MVSINPANGATIKTYREDTAEEIALKIDRVHATWLSYKETSYTSRAGLLTALSALLKDKQDEFATLMALEMGKPLAQGVAEVLKCAALCEYYAAHGEAFLADQLISTAASKSYVSFRPLGVVLAVMPWNFPFWQVFRFIVPALMAGNCAVLKHSSGVSGCALAIAQVITDAGFEGNVFTALICSSKEIAVVIDHPKIKAVTLTGSTGAGIDIASKAGKALKKTVLELGGSDPYLVLADADLPAAAKICADARLINNGQSCIAAKRFIVVKDVEEEFTQLFKARMEEKTTGDPFEEGVDLGPMARIDLRDELHQQVQQCVEQGAKCILGGVVPADAATHAYYPPTILTGVKKGMLAYAEEIFGPVAAIITAEDTDDALRIANDTSFGLGAAIFTRNAALAEDLARNKLDAGSCFVNAGVKSDQALPFGGINQSGYGRELGMFGIHEFVNIKTVYIQ